MKEPFKDSFDEHKGKEKKDVSIWNNKTLPYDERSSCFANVGQHHGVGKAQPIGHEGNAKPKAECLPMTSKCIMDFQKKKTITVQE